MVLHQVISRRGTPKEIWSNKGTNFVGANFNVPNIHYGELLFRATLKKLSFSLIEK